MVTGGCRGIGRAIADALAAAGAEVDVFDVDEPQPATNFAHRFARVDITDADRRRGRGRRPCRRRPTLLVNNAGITRDRSLREDERRRVGERASPSI